MKDAFGGILNIVFIAVFLIIVSGILAFIVNYNKAFRMKNTVITAIEKYEGASGCFSGDENGCSEKIKKNAERYGYSPTKLNCEQGYKSVGGLFCVSRETTESGNHEICKIVTQVDIDIPIISDIMGLSIFQVHGDTRPMEKCNAD